MTNEPHPWRDWLARMNARLRQFSTVTIPDLPQPFWGDAAIGHVCDVYAEFFPAVRSVSDPSKFDTVDLFVRWIGETYIRRVPGMEWFTHPHAAQGLYPAEIGPGLRHPQYPLYETYVIEILEWAAQDGLHYVRKQLMW